MDSCRHCSAKDKMATVRQMLEYFQFPAKTGFTLRCNPGGGISAALGPARPG